MDFFRPPHPLNLENSRIFFFFIFDPFPNLTKDLYHPFVPSYVMILMCHRKECVFVLSKTYFVLDATKRLDETRLHFNGATSDLSSSNEGVNNCCVSITPSSLQSCIHLLSILDKLNSDRIFHFCWFDHGGKASRVTCFFVTLDEDRTLGDLQALRDKNSSCYT